MSASAVKRGYIDVKKIQLHFHYAGVRENPAISIFHPSPGSARQLHFLIEALSKNFLSMPLIPREMVCLILWIKRFQK